MEWFTRDLYDRSQTEDESLWPRIEAEWEAAETQRHAVFESLRELWPHPVREFFASQSLHDGVIQSVERREPEQLAMVLNTKGAPWVTGTLCRLNFFNVQLAEGIDDLIGQWWLYDEFHPGELGAFDLRVLCDKSEFRIVAGDLTIECT